MGNGTADAALARAVGDVRAIALDWNGTTLDDIDRAIDATNKVLLDRRIEPLTPVRFRETFQLPMDIYFRGLGVPESLVSTSVADWNGYLVEGSIRLGRGVTQLLEAAGECGIPVGIVSAADANVVERDARRLGILESLSFVAGGARPKSQTLRELTARYGSPILYCGDTEYDVSEAKAAGAIAVAFTGGYRTRLDLLGAEPDFEIEDFSVIASLLRETKMNQVVRE